ncbi:hypothetical protein [Halobacteriovorax sp. JY17]|uniref:hypothetical protein n=1 Tax=Halobacteriovorax sp. JY17 TaxID=2014617 RepID=UPI000C4F6B33|nr:hypothetical protein [Halobacteriovorax sp. JY17]PIK14508.1 MAG: hypothetical protein CES88_09185 [Halobacteriovorax sp. JY17]
MIKIEVLNSINPYLLGHHKNYGNIFLFGKSSKYNLTDPSFDNFKLSVERDKLYIENIVAGVFYNINGKKISGKKSLNIGDELRCKEFHFKISAFEYSHIDPMTDIDNLYKKRIEESPEIEQILIYIEQEFIHLEKLKYHEK